LISITASASRRSFIVLIPRPLGQTGTDAPDLHRRQTAHELFAVIPSDGIPHTDPAEVGVLLHGPVARLARVFKASKVLNT
jgi:hypothetical protein